MEIKIRNVDSSAVAKIDEMARQKGMSRNEYLKLQIHSMAILEELKIAEDKYITLSKTMATVVNENTIIMTKIMQQLEMGE